MKPLVIFNFKAYEESTFPKSSSLLKAISKTKSKNYELIVCPQTQELLFLKKEFPKLEFFAQDVSKNSFGAFTGKIGFSQLKKIGVKGAIVNHSESKKHFEELKEICIAASKEKFKLIVCVDSLMEAALISSFHPWAIAFEPPELIGSGKSVSTHKPELIARFVEMLSEKKIIPIVGAGVSTNFDLEKSLELGAEGVLLASAFVKAKNPEKWLKEFLN